MINMDMLLSLIAIGTAIGGIFITIGIFKSKIGHNADANAVQDEQIKTLASKNELAAAVKRSDELLALMKERAEEDRQKNQGQYREYQALFTGQEKRLSSLETQQTALMKSFDELKMDIKSGFKELQAELKELQNELKEQRKHG